MKIWTFSDPHVDVYPKRGFKLPDPLPKADVLVVAGDVQEKLRRSLGWLNYSTGWRGPIVYVAGNHDFYRTAIDDERAKAAAGLTAINHERQEAGWGAIHLLQDSFVDLSGVRFIGATLWTNYECEGIARQYGAMMHANQCMNDHRFIRVAAHQYRCFRAQDALDEHRVSEVYIHKALLGTPESLKRVVVTHHSPSRHSVHKQYVGDLLNAAYASNLDHIACLADLWIHGHTHHSFDYPINGCRVLCNPRGYGGDNKDFIPNLVVEV